MTGARSRLERQGARSLTFAIGAGLALALAPGDALAQSNRGGGSTEPGGAAHYLTPPSNRAPLEIALDEVDRSLASLRSAERATDEEHRVEELFSTARTGTTHIRLRQYLRGIRVWNGDYAVHVNRDGRIIAAHDRFRGDRQSRNGDVPRLEAEEAAQRAAGELGLDGAGPFPVLETHDDHGRSLVLDPGDLSQDPIPVELVYVRDSSGVLRLAWNLIIRELSDLHWWELNIDAAIGEILTQSDYFAHDTYRVFPFPSRNPNDGSHTLVVDPADLGASPFGWHDLNGNPGAETQFTLGNNADVARRGSRPSGGATRDFDFPVNLNQLTLNAPITNTFYWLNWLHDLHYQYGFDEPAGNFQGNNYGNGGSASDRVDVEIQDAEPNAAFATPRDGLNPIMILGVFSVNPTVTIDSPLDIARDLEARGAEFGPPLDASGISGTVVAALDAVEGVGFTNTDACSPLSNAADINGRIALVDRGVCLFIVKVANAQDAGAIAVVVANNVPGPPGGMAGTDPSIVIPSVGITQRDGRFLRDNLSRGVVTTLRTPERDASYDSEVIIHEFGHGISVRLTGGRFAASCLNDLQSAALGEGWSDFWAVALLTLDSHSSDDVRPVSTFLLAQPLEGAGFRNFPYTSDLAINPLTFRAIAFLNLPHGAGEVWALALLQMYWNLVADHGFDPDVRFGVGGNNIALELVMDALKLQPCNPDFLQARDAIFQADLVSNDSANTCAIWNAFAKRGMGVQAASLNGSNDLVVSEDFTVPPMCVPEPAEWLAQLFAGLTLALIRRR